MKVCMLAEKLPPEFTGSGRQAAFLAKALITKGVHPVGLCSNPAGNSGIDVDWGFPICRIHTSSTEWLRSLEFAIKSTIWLLKHRSEYDILHVHGYCGGGLIGSIVAKMLGKKAIYKITLPGEDDPEALYHSGLGEAKIFLLRQFDVLVSISDRIQKRIEAFNSKKTRIFTIPNGVDERFCLDEAISKEARRKLITTYQLSECTQIVSYMGSIEYRKGIDILARAWSRIVLDLPYSRLFLVGPFFEATPFCKQLKVFNYMLSIF